VSCPAGPALLAEIPVVSADPSELENLRVALASPVTFERVGLQRPTGLVGELQFELTRNAQGRAVVRVTSQAPVETPSLSFLIEADWGQGRLVREYSALVDAPSSALAVAEPEIVAPAGTLSNTIAREPPARPAPAAPAPTAATAGTRLGTPACVPPRRSRQRPMAASPSSAVRPCRRSPARWPAATRSAATAR
jgi:pilus assembly protein FimV